MSCRYLIDTHILLWDLTDSEKLKDQHRIILQGSDVRFLSIVSIWEIAIKVSIRKLPMPDNLLMLIDESDVEILPISPEHALHTKTLPHHHSDPFDRMLVAQAQLEDLKIMTMDKRIPLYDVATI